MVANKGIICTKIGCRFDEKHQMRQPLFLYTTKKPGQIRIPSKGSPYRPGFYYLLTALQDVLGTRRVVS